MCLMIYLGSDNSKPTSTWDEENPIFYVGDNNVQYVDEEQGLIIKEVESKFSKKHTYYIGSHEGCGCSFRREGFWMQDDAEEIKKTNENHNHLYQYILECLKDENSVEMYACWAGNESDGVKSKRKIRVQEIVQSNFFFEEDELVIVGK